MPYGQPGDMPYCEPGDMEVGGESFCRHLPSLPMGMADSHLWVGYTYGNTDRTGVQNITRAQELPSPSASVSFDGGYSTVGGFFPWYTQFPNGNWFLQTEWHYTDEDQNMASIGFGRRILLDERMYGMSFWYEFDEAGDDNLPVGDPFHQIGLNVETRGPWFDMFMNWYQPVGDQTYFTGSPDGGPAFFQHNILIQSGLDMAMQGMDAEIQVALPFMDCLDPHAAFGGYAYRDEDDNNRLNGYYGRFTFNPTPRTSFNVRINHDDTNETTVAAQIAFGFGTSQRFACGSQLLDLPVRRLDHIVRFKQDQVLATNPATGDPWIVQHVDNTALPGGDGSFERPYNELDLVNGAGSAENDLIFVAVGTGTNLNYDAQVVLKDGQLFLGQGTRHFIDTVEVGNFRLPGFISGPDGERLAPMITATGGTSVTLADMNRVAGFDIDGSNIAIAGTGITDFDINNNLIDDINNEAILITDAAGTGTISENEITDGGSHAIVLASTGTGTTLNTTVTDNEIEDNQGDAVNITVDDGDVWTVEANGNNFNNNDSGIVANINGTGRLTLNATGNDIEENQDAGIRAIVNGTAGGLQATIDSNNNSINDNQQFGVDLQLAAGNTGSVQANFTGDSINNTGSATSLQGVGVNANVLGAALTLSLDNVDVIGTDQSGTGLAANRQGAVNINVDTLGTFNGTISNGSNITQTVGGSGVYLNSQSAGPNSLAISTSNLNLNDIGLSIQTGGTATTTVTVSGGQMNTNSVRALDVTANSSGTTTVNVNGTAVTGNQQGGMRFNAGSSGTLNTTITGVSFNNNTVDDINIAAVGSVLVNAQILNNTNINSSEDGLVVSAGGTSAVGILLSGNNFNGSGAAGNAVSLTSTGQGNIWATLEGDNDFQDYNNGIFARANNGGADTGIALNIDGSGTTTIDNMAVQGIDLLNSNNAELFAWINGVQATGTNSGFLAVSESGLVGGMHLRLVDNTVNTGTAANDYVLFNDLGSNFSFDVANSTGNENSAGAITGAQIFADMNLISPTPGTNANITTEFNALNGAGEIGNPPAVLNFTPPSP
jgi:hypothetical protein